jgi:uncharacterized protein YkwD
LALSSSISVEDIHDMRKMSSAGLAAIVLASRLFAQSPPASAAEYRRLESEILSELNVARTDPAKYAEHLATLLPLYTGTLFQRPGARFAIQTHEGVLAVREAIDALRREKPVPPLALDKWLSKAALDHATDQGQTGELGHGGSDKSGPGDRANRYGSWIGTFSENIAYGADVSGYDVIDDLLIDDGVSSRGHRHNIFDPRVHVVGIGCGPHPKYTVVCVIDQADAFVPRAGDRQN